MIVPTDRLAKDGNATTTNPFTVSITGSVGKNQAVNSLWTRYVFTHDQEGNFSGNTTDVGLVKDLTANPAAIQFEVHAQSESTNQPSMLRWIETLLLRQIREQSLLVKLVSTSRMPKGLREFPTRELLRELEQPILGNLEPIQIYQLVVIS